MTLSWWTYLYISFFICFLSLFLALVSIAPFWSPIWCLPSCTLNCTSWKLLGMMCHKRWVKDISFTVQMEEGWLLLCVFPLVDLHLHASKHSLEILHQSMDAGNSRTLLFSSTCLNVLWLVLSYFTSQSSQHARAHAVLLCESLFRKNQQSWIFFTLKMRKENSNSATRRKQRQAVFEAPWNAIIH